MAGEADVDEEADLDGGSEFRSGAMARVYKVIGCEGGRVR